MANAVVPRFFRVAESPFGSDRTYVCFLEARDLAIITPRVIPLGTPLETPPIHTQGFNQFQGLLSAAGAGASLRIEYGICHPTTLAVLGYRALFAAAALSTTMLTSFGARGQSVATFQGDLFTAFTLRLSANLANVTLNDIVLWFAAG